MKRDEFITFLYNKFIDSYPLLLMKNPRLQSASADSGFDLSYIKKQSPSYLIQLINTDTVRNKLMSFLDDDESIEEFNKLIKNIQKL